MTRKDMVVCLVHFCDNCDNCHTCLGNEFCIGMAEECDAIGESVFALMTDAEVYDMYLKCCEKIRSEGDNDNKGNH